MLTFLVDVGTEPRELCRPLAGLRKALEGSRTLGAARTGAPTRDGELGAS